MRILNSKHSSIVFCERNAVPRIVYFGKRLELPLDETQMTSALIHALPQGSMDEAAELSIASSFADPIFLNPAIKIHRESQLWAPQWKLLENEATHSDVRYKLTDKKSGLFLVWHLSVDAETNVFTIDVCIENKGANHIEIDQWLTTFPLPLSFENVTSFTGRWIQEFQPQHQKLVNGALEFTNWRGRTSHDHFPGAVIGDESLSTVKGDCIAFHLGWSGNHQQRVERSQNGLSQYQAGVALMPGEVILAPGEKFQSAPLYVTRSETGFAGIGENFQPFVRNNILKFPSNNPRPVHINTWEALYFNHDQNELDSLAAAASECGAERYVLDDGWFLGRRDDTSGLGDWVIDESVYPQGLHPLKATLKKNNLGFGLWFEPEVVNKKSKLYEQHPDWVLQIEGQHQAAGRNQWVLDITRPEAQDYLFNQISDILRDYPIEYIKWDMNRDLLQAGNQHGHPAYHDYILSLYQLLDRIRSEYPHVEIESCASGGGRMDYGILKRTHRFWLSDCNDANERQQMQQWASLFFPAEVLGSHVGPTISHTTSRSHPLFVRAGTALFGHMGVEWDVRQATDIEKIELKKYIQLYKDLRENIHKGIRTPIEGSDKNQIAFQVTDGATTLVSVFQKDTPNTSVQASLKFPFINKKHNYNVEVLMESENIGHLMKRKPVWMQNRTKQYSGELLAQLGLPLPILDPESLVVLRLTEV
jgi:alpha-galactosidase